MPDVTPAAQPETVPPVAVAASKTKAVARPAHPWLAPRLLVPLVAAIILVQLPFLHAALRGGAEVTKAVPLEDKFERAELGDDYFSNGGHWRIVSGQLFSPGVGNNPLWLKARLPDNVRVAFDVRSEGPDGDIKWELFGDGRNHASGYVFLFGAWHNRENRIARLDEHALTADELRAQLAQQAHPYPRNLTGLEGLFESIREPFAAWGARRDLASLSSGTYYGPDVPLVVKRPEPHVVKGYTYHEVITRRDNLLRWEQDGQLVLELNDPFPLHGSGHDRFGFSSWQNDTYFDNLDIRELF